MLAELGIVGVDHIAVTGADFQQTLDGYLALPGAVLCQAPGWNATQQVHYAFVELAPGLRLEVLGPDPDLASPIDGHVKAGGGAYHLCYAVRDLDAALQSAERLGGKIIAPAIADVAFQGRRIAFVFAPGFGLFELVEATEAAKSLQAKPTLPASAHRAPTVGYSDAALASLLVSLFPDLRGLEPAAMKIDACPAWDSLGQQQLIMAVEREFETRVPSQKIATLSSFQALSGYLGSPDG